MDKEHVKGAVDKTKGAVKDAVGGLTGNRSFRLKASWTRQKARCVKLLAT